MKTKSALLNARRARPQAAFTLPELMVSMTVFILLLGGVIFANLYGLSMFRITETKLTATDEARKTIGRMADEIRSCKSASVGNVKNGVFETLLNGEKQEGAGLAIYPTTNKSQYVMYFILNSTNLTTREVTRTFRRTTGKPGTAIVLAENITNSIAFRVQNHLGVVQTNNSNSRVIHFSLEFFQAKRRLQIADYYKLETSVTRRALE